MSGAQNMPDQALAAQGWSIQTRQWMDSVVNATRGFNAIDMGILVGAAGAAGTPEYPAITGSIIPGWGFTDQSVEANEKRVICRTILPYSVKAGSDLIFRISYTYDIVVASAVVDWQIEYEILNVKGDPISNTSSVAVELPMALPDSVTGLRVQYRDLITIRNNANVQEGACVIFKLRRHSSVAADTYTDGSILLIGASAVVFCDKVGTARSTI